MANHVGIEFANRFRDEIRPKVPSSSTPMAHHRYTLGQNTAAMAAGELAPKISENIYESKIGTRIKNAVYATQISRGKKAVSDVFDYNSIVGKVLDEEGVFNNGQSQFAKLVRDTISNGGNVPTEILSKL